MSNPKLRFDFGLNSVDMFTLSSGQPVNTMRFHDTDKVSVMEFDDFSCITFGDYTNEAKLFLRPGEAAAIANLLKQMRGE